MKKMLTGVLLACVLSVFFAGGQAVMVPADEVINDIQGEPGIYLYIKEVPGECTEVNHDGWIEVSSMYFGAHEPEGGARGNSRRRGAVIVEDLEMTKELDKSSPKIAEAVCEGKNFPKVEIDVISSTVVGPQSLVKYELKNVVFKSYWHSADVGEDVSTEDVFTMSFEEITMAYTEYDDTGKPMGTSMWEYVNKD